MDSGEADFQKRTDKAGLKGQPGVYTPAESEPDFGAIAFVGDESRQQEQAQTQPRS